MEHQHDEPRRAPTLASRRLDIGKLLDLPPARLPWRCDRLAADGFVTVLTGEGGEGKSFLTLALAKAVAEGGSAAGIACRPGRVLSGGLWSVLCVEFLTDLVRDDDRHLRKVERLLPPMSETLFKATTLRPSSREHRRTVFL